MPTTRFSNEPHYVESVRALLRLHEFEVAGASESSEADAVRDSLERPWLLLSEPERKRITGLSEDLYSITIPTATAEMTPQAQCGLIEAFEARKAGRWDQALELMRQWGTHIEPALCSYLRGSIWMEAGDSSTASVFFRHAASDSARANLFEWIGISRSELGMPAQTVREAFEEALRLAPDNDRIRSNFRAFEAAIASQKNLPVAWQKASEVTVQALGRIQYDPALAA